MDWDSPGKNIGVGCHFHLQGIFPTEGSNPGLPGLQTGRVALQVEALTSEPPGEPSIGDSLFLEHPRNCHRQGSLPARQVGKLLKSKVGFAISQQRPDALFPWSWAQGEESEFFQEYWWLVWEEGSRSQTDSVSCNGIVWRHRDREAVGNMWSNSTWGMWENILKSQNLTDTSSIVLSKKERLKFTSSIFQYFFLLLLSFKIHAFFFSLLSLNTSHTHLPYVLCLPCPDMISVGWPNHSFIWW